MSEDVTKLAEAVSQLAAAQKDHTALLEKIFQIIGGVEIVHDDFDAGTGQFDLAEWLKDLKDLKGDADGEW